MEAPGNGFLFLNEGLAYAYTERESILPPMHGSWLGILLEPNFRSN